MDDLSSPPKYNLTSNILAIIIVAIFIILLVAYSNSHYNIDVNNEFSIANLTPFNLSKKSKYYSLKKPDIKIYLIEFLAYRLLYYFNKNFINILEIEYLCFKMKLCNYNYINIHSPPY